MYYKCTLLSFLICCRTMNQSKLVQRNMLVRYVGLSVVLRQKFAGTILYILVKSHLLAHIVTLPLIREAIVIAIWESIMARITQICNFNPNCQINSPHLNLGFFLYLAWLDRSLSILLKCLFILLQNKPVPVHVGPAKWACSICGVVRSRPAEIKRHFLTHTGEKPFECTHCPARFNLKANCKSHIRKYHEPPEVEPQMYMKLSNSWIPI